MAQLKHYTAAAPRSLSDILIFEIDPRFSRESGELAPLAEKLPLGAVLAQNESGQFIPFGLELAPAVEAVAASEGVEGSEAKPAVLADQPVAILISRDCEASEEAQPCAVLKRGAVVAAANLFWLDSVIDEQKQTALTQLGALGIVPKE